MKKEYQKEEPGLDDAARQVVAACMAYRHDFGLLSEAEQEALYAEALRWLEAWGKVMEREAKR